MSTTTTISITETAIFTAVGTVLSGYNLLSSTANSNFVVIRGQRNRVPPPILVDYLVMWPLNRLRLSTNIDTLTDNSVVGYIVSNVFTVTQIVNGSIAPGQIIYGYGVAAGCYVVAQLSGTAGGTGTYSVSNTANVEYSLVYDPVGVVQNPGGALYGPGEQTFYLGTNAILQPTEFVVQCDVHGPYSGDNAQIITTLFRDDFTFQAFNALTNGIYPLYNDDAKQIPFINAEAQWEERYCIDLHLQVNPLVSVTQQFASALSMTLQEIQALSH